MAKLDEKIIREMYEIEGLTDQEISEEFSCDRTTVVHFRKNHGISTRNVKTDVASELVLENLLKMGLDAKNAKLNDKTYPVDILIDNQIRIEVKSAVLLESEGCYKFLFTEKEDNQNIESENRIKLANGRTRKLLSKTCDFIVFVGFNDADPDFWIMPSNILSDTMQTISLLPYSVMSKYNKYKNAWRLLQEFGSENVLV
ncbi:hypothetical protein KZX50_00565 [Bacillus infantis]|uniref:hypothetical protein n=1 Tax=Bacillus infantis TaxID=324767 RepID=UPI002006D91C|nr:hypothetical protein [Bacillus infantis]MCK6203940.1 hypothetical protein [Bacillus infantis]